MTRRVPRPAVIAPSAPARAPAPAPARSVTPADLRDLARDCLAQSRPTLERIARGDPIPQTRVTPDGGTETVMQHPPASVQRRARALLARITAAEAAPTVTWGDIAAGVFGARATPTARRAAPPTDGAPSRASASLTTPPSLLLPWAPSAIS